MRKAFLPGVFLLLFAFGCGQSTGGDDSPLKGKPAPDFSAPTLSGGTQSLAAQKGKVVVLDFWATWCPPCKASLPHVQSISADSNLAGKGLVVWAINQAEDNKTIQDFLDQNHYVFTVLKDDGPTSQKYGVQGIPTTVIIGRDGIVRNVFVGFGDGSADQIDAAIKQALDESAPKNPA